MSRKGKATAVHISTSCSHLPTAGSADHSQRRRKEGESRISGARRGARGGIAGARSGIGGARSGIAGTRSGIGGSGGIFGPVGVCIGSGMILS